MKLHRLLQHMFVQGDLTRRLATELLDKYWNSNSHYMDPSDLDDAEDAVGSATYTVAAE